MSKGKIIVAVLGGAAAAAALAYLFATDKGKGMRSDLADTVSELCKKIINQATDLVDGAMENAQKTRARSTA